MFDFAFSELAVILLVVIIVIGTEWLPKVARTAGCLWGRMQRSVHSVKNGIANDMAIEEARQLHSSIRQKVAAVGQFVQEAGLTLEQQILQAYYKKPPAAPDEPAQSVAQFFMPSKQV